MKVFGIAGWSGSGKTTLMLGLVAELRRRGLRVSTVKHSHHPVEVDRPGDDSRRLLEAGAAEVLMAGPKRWALIHRAEQPAGLAELLPRLTEGDVLLVEGFKRAGHAKLEVYRPELGKPLLHPDDPAVVAIATAAPGPFTVPRYHPDDLRAIADLALKSG